MSLTKINCGRKCKPQVIHVDRIRKKYSQNLPGEESEQIESHEETVFPVSWYAASLK